jgi:hypothetical protein
VARIHCKFIKFHNNRVESSFTKEKERHAAQEAIPKDSKPTINPISNSLAIKFREASLKRMESNQAFNNKGNKFVDYLNYMGFEYSCKKVKEPEEEIIQKTDYSNLEKYWKEEPSKRVQELYKSGCNKLRCQKLTKELNMNIQENTNQTYTYRPNIQCISPKITNVYSKESVDKTVKRMEIGRLKSMTQQWLTKKGFAGGKVVNKIKSIESNVPKLNISLVP